MPKVYQSLPEFTNGLCILLTAVVDNSSYLILRELEINSARMCYVPRVYFHVCTYFYETCTLHATSKHGPRKHVTGRQCSILMVPRVITRVNFKLQLSGTIIVAHRQTVTCWLCWLCHPACLLWCGERIAWPTWSTSQVQTWYVPQEEMTVLLRYGALPLPSTADTAIYCSYFGQNSYLHGDALPSLLNDDVQRSGKAWIWWNWPPCQH